MSETPEMSNVNGVMIPNFDKAHIEPSFPESEVPTAEDEEDNDGATLDKLIEEWLKSLQATSETNDREKNQVTIQTCQADLQNCADKLGIR